MQGESHSEATRWQAARDAVVQQHIDAENRHDLVALIATFSRPSYELVALDSAAIGATAVADLLGRFMTAFPNLHTTVFAVYHADVAVIVEGQLVGTQTGPWLGLPAAGRSINLPFVAIFKFDEDRLLGKKVYFDSGLLMRQLTNE
jgi:steroid delta-isomerase-like uncharacterized protein